MKEYTIIYKNKPTETISARGRIALIEDHFNGDEGEFKTKVNKLVWDELSMQCVLDVATNKVSSQLVTADVNPYGWRNA